MDALDIILVVVVLASAIRGLRLGAAVQVLSFGGLLAGLALGVGLVLVIGPHIGGQRTKTFVALVLLLLPAALLAGVGRQIGAGLWKRLRRARFGSIDAFFGAIVAVAGSLVVAWFLASILVNSQFSLVSNQIQNSRVLREVAGVMPPIPTALAPVEHFLSAEGLPQVYVDLVQGAGPVQLPTNAQVREAVLVAGSSTVKVVGIGCGQIQEGSGFVVAPGLVVTNAHVIAGTHQLTVSDATGTHEATAILFDPEFDIAVLRVQSLSDRPLRLDPALVGRGAEAAVLGYPGGGPFDAVQAGLVSAFQATGLDIYGQNTTVRSVYELQAVVRPGNSGGPLVEQSGLVIGVVFSRSANRPDIGYALASPGVLQRVHTAQSEPASFSVGTGACIAG